MPYSYTNRRGKTHYFRAAKTKKGNYRYYITSSEDFSNLIEEVPDGFEIAELPEDAKVVIRKIKPRQITKEEEEATFRAIQKFSALNDFFIHSEEDVIYVYHSQFNYVGGQEENLDREEAKGVFGDHIEKWMRFFTAMLFRLVDREKRLFQTERKVFMGAYGHTFHPVGEVGKIEDLAKEYGQHLGRDSFYEIEPNTEL